MLNSNELLHSLLAGERLSAKNIDTMVSDLTEDQYLEFKHGDKIQKAGPAAAFLREYVSAFANSEGGILVIGVAEPVEGQFEVSGCKAPGGKSLKAWASQALTDLAPSLYPLPRFFDVNHSAGHVLIIAVPRSQSLIPCIVSGKIVYYIRMHDQTLPCPEFLINDLLLHNRSRPLLQISNISLARVAGHTPETANGVLTNLDFQILLDNRSLTWADEITLGFIAYQPIKQPFKHRINEHLLPFFDYQRVDEFAANYELVNTTVNLPIPNIPPFGTTSANFPTIHIAWPFPPLKLQDTTFRTVLYILARDTPPVWYQFDVQINKSLFFKANVGDRNGQVKNLSFANAWSMNDLERYEEFIQFHLVTGQRPIVTIITA